jgi:hypothetical protein
LFSAIYGKEMWDLSPLNPKNNIQKLPELPFKKTYQTGNGALQSYIESYVQKVVQMLNAFDNVYYEIQNEPWADEGVEMGFWNDYIQAAMLKEQGNIWRCRLEIANEKSLLWQKRVAEIIREAEKNLPKKHLISQNFANFQYPLSNLAPNIDIFSFHYAQPKSVTQNYHWNKPISFNETGFSVGAMAKSIAVRLGDLCSVEAHSSTIWTIPSP